MKKRVLTGIQPSGRLHLGNYFGTIKRMVDYQESSDLFLFIANLHALTTCREPKQLLSQTKQAALDLLALGIDPHKSHFWIQSDVPEVAELSWVLSCTTPMGLMERAHSYKDKTARGIRPSLGLFSYPVLMTADILLYHAEVIPVGKDQKQHMEIARDIALKFNHEYGDILTVPEPDIAEDVAVIPGIDGQKMSKSYHNTIDIFSEKKELEKKVMSIKTDSTPVDEPKDHKNCTIYQLYTLFADKGEAGAMADRYKTGGFGYGEAKRMLFEKIWDYFEPHRAKRKKLEQNDTMIRQITKKGAEKARSVGLKTLDEVRNAVGFNKFKN